MILSSYFYHRDITKWIEYRNSNTGLIDICIISVYSKISKSLRELNLIESVNNSYLDLILKSKILSIKRYTVYQD